VGVRERRDHLDHGLRNGLLGHLQRDLHLRFLIRRNLGEHEVRTIAVTEQTGAVRTGDLQLISQGLEELRGLAPVVGGQEDSLDRHVMNLPGR
jgi:hypothetical protein